MKLSEVFSGLTYGELSQLSIGGGAAGFIDATNYSNVLTHVNLGLGAIYRRFPLKEGQVTFLFEPGRINYPMDSNGDVVFTEGFDGDFADDILKIEKVETLAGVELGLNDASDPYGCSTPTMTTIRVPAKIVSGDLSVPPEYQTTGLIATYRAGHPVIVKTGANFNPARVELELPYAYLEPLLFFVASRVHNPIGLTNEFHAGNSYYAKYEKACADLETQNLSIDQSNQNTGLQRNGWV